MLSGKLDAVVAVVGFYNVIALLDQIVFNQIQNVMLIVNDQDKRIGQNAGLIVLTDCYWKLHTLHNEKNRIKLTNCYQSEVLEGSF